LIVFAPDIDQEDVPQDVYVIAPDGAQILFSRRTGNGDRAIWIMNADGTAPAPVTHASTSQIYPTLSAE
jgi:hypothetical protein